MDVKRILKTSSRTKVGEYIPSGFSMSTISSFKTKENKHDVYRGKDCMKTFCEFLREHTMEIINVKKKKNEVINKQTNSRNHTKRPKFVIFVKKDLKINVLKIKTIVKSEIIVIIPGNIEVAHITYVI